MIKSGQKNLAKGRITGEPPNYPYPLKTRAPPNIWFLEPTRVHNPNDRQTDRQTARQTNKQRNIHAHHNTISIIFIYHTRTEHKMQKLSRVNKSMEGYLLEEKLQFTELAAYANQTELFNMSCNNNNKWLLHLHIVETGFRQCQYRHVG